MYKVGPQHSWIAKAEYDSIHNFRGGMEQTSSKIPSPGKEPGPSHPVYCKPVDQTALPGCEVRTLYRHVGADNGRLDGACGHYYYLNSVSKYPYVTTTLSAHSCNSWDAGVVVIEDPHNQRFLKNLVFLSLALRSIRKSNQGQHDSSTMPGSQASTPYRYDQKVIESFLLPAHWLAYVTWSHLAEGNLGNVVFGWAVSYYHGEERMGITGQLTVSTLLPCSQTYPTLELESFLRTVYLRRCGHNTPIIFLFLGR